MFMQLNMRLELLYIVLINYHISQKFKLINTTNFSKMHSEEQLFQDR